MRLPTPPHQFSELLGISCLLLLGTAIFVDATIVNSGCQPFTLAEGLEQIGGIGVAQARLVSVLLAALTLACIYRLTAQFLGRRFAWMGVIVAAIIAGQLAPLGWTIFGGWLGLLLALILLTLWSLHRHIVILILSVGSVGTLLWLIAGHSDELLKNLSGISSLLPQLPVSIAALWLIAVIGITIGPRDNLNATIRYRLWLGGLVCIVGLVGSFSNLYAIILPIFWVIMALGVTCLLHLLSERTRIIALIAGFLLFCLPRYFVAFPDAESLIVQHQLPETSFLIDSPNAYPLVAEALNIAGHLCRPPLGFIAVMLDNETALVKDSSGFTNLVAATTLSNTPSLLTVSNATSENAPDKIQVFTQDIPGADDDLTLSYFATRPENTVFLTDALTLHSFDIREPETLTLMTTFSAGDAFVVSSWWSALTQTPENYILAISLVGADGQPVARSEQLLANSFTGSWQPGTFHYDRQVISLPANLQPGDYSLVLSIHGSVKNLHNLVFRSAAGAPIGEYGFLYSISIKPQ